MARFQTGIVWKDGAQQFFGIFQVHEAVLCGNVGHTQYSFLTFGLELESERLFKCEASVQLNANFGNPRSGNLQTLWEAEAILLLGESDVLFWGCF